MFINYSQLFQCGLCNCTRILLICVAIITVPEIRFLQESISVLFGLCATDRRDNGIHCYQRHTQDTIEQTCNLTTC